MLEWLWCSVWCEGSIYPWATCEWRTDILVYFPLTARKWIEDFAAVLECNRERTYPVLCTDTDELSKQPMGYEIDRPQWWHNGNEYPSCREEVAQPPVLMGAGLSIALGGTTSWVDYMNLLYNIWGAKGVWPYGNKCKCISKVHVTATFSHVVALLEPDKYKKKYLLSCKN